MGVTSKKQQDIPESTEFQNVPAFDNTVREPKTGIGIPTEEAVHELKSWMNVNKQ